MEVQVIEPGVFYDDRGFFSETWNKRKFAEVGIMTEFVQDNHSISYESGTLRGLHFQSPPHAQAKLVRCGRGRLFDVAVDIRKKSPRFGQWISEELSFENRKQLFIPVGFLHGFVTLEPDTEIIYKCSDFYAPECEVAVRFDDPDLAIDWPLTGNPILNQKDATGLFMCDFETPFVHGVNS